MSDKAKVKNDPTRQCNRLDSHVSHLWFDGGMYWICEGVKLIERPADIPIPPKPDLINHPPHYTAHPSGVECIQVTEHMTFNLGNAVKYLWRSSEKGTQLSDLHKAAWYINREIQRLEKDDEV